MNDTVTTQENAAPVEAKAKKVKAPKEPRVQAEMRNGVRRPLDPTGIVGRVWAIADSISEAMKAPAPRGAVREQGEAEGLNSSTINTQYAKWRTFHGLTGTTSGVAAAEKPKKEKKAKVVPAPEEPTVV